MACITSRLGTSAICSTVFHLTTRAGIRSPLLCLVKDGNTLWEKKILLGFNTLAECLLLKVMPLILCSCFPSCAWVLRVTCRLVGYLDAAWHALDLAPKEHSSIKRAMVGKHWDVIELLPFMKAGTSTSESL